MSPSAQPRWTEQRRDSHLVDAVPRPGLQVPQDPGQVVGPLLWLAARIRRRPFCLCQGHDSRCEPEAVVMCTAACMQCSLLLLCCQMCARCRLVLCSMHTKTNFPGPVLALYQDQRSKGCIMYLQRRKARFPRLRRLGVREQPVSAGRAGVCRRMQPPGSWPGRIAACALATSALRLRRRVCIPPPGSRITRGCRIQNNTPCCSLAHSAQPSRHIHLLAVCVRMLDACRQPACIAPRWQAHQVSGRIWRGEASISNQRSRPCAASRQLPR